jgi:dTDP-glucose pyrophosphorylase
LLGAVKKLTEPKSNPAVIGVCAFDQTVLEIYPKLKRFGRN